MKQMSKRITTLLLALVLCLAPVTASAAPDSERAEGRINGISDGDIMEYAPVTLIRKGGSREELSSEDLSSLEVGPGDEIRVFLTADMFTWDSPNEDNAYSEGLAVTKNQLSTAKITVKRKISKGSDVIEAIAFESDGGAVFIKVETVDPFVSTSEKDLDFEIYLAQKSKKAVNTEVTIAGTIKNEVVEVGADDDYVDTSEGVVVEATDYISNIEVNLGNGVSIKTNMFKDRKYYGITTMETDSEDDTIMAQYPEIDSVYYLNTINMNSAGNTVTFDIDGSYHVYNADGDYLGMSDEKVEVSHKYYMASAPVDITGGDADSDG